MYKLTHHQLCPLSRQARIFLEELELEHQLIREDYWQRRPEFLQVSPFGILPILEKEELLTIGYYSIIEFLHESKPDSHLMPKNIEGRSLVRQQILWFNDKFYREVSKIIVDEKIIRPLTGLGEPRGEYLRVSKSNLNKHFALLESYLENSPYLVSEQVSFADIAAASHISVIDYFGEIYWDRWPRIKQWYAMLKSRPSMGAVLADRIPGLHPPSYYSDPDF